MGRMLFVEFFHAIKPTWTNYSTFNRTAVFSFDRTTTRRSAVDRKERDCEAG